MATLLPLVVRFLLLPALHNERVACVKPLEARERALSDDDLDTGASTRTRHGPRRKGWHPSFSSNPQGETRSRRRGPKARLGVSPPQIRLSF